MDKAGNNIPNTTTRQATITDTDRINALITLFGGAYAFEPFFRVQQHFQKGRRSLDEWIFANPSLLEKPTYTCPRGVDSTTAETSNQK